MENPTHDLKGIAALLASKGRGGDTMLAHINPQEAALLKAMGGSGTTNPKTGLPEYFEFNDIFKIFDPLVQASQNITQKVSNEFDEQREKLKTPAGMQAVFDQIQSGKDLRNAFANYDYIKQNAPDLVQKYAPQFKYFDTVRGYMNHRIGETGGNLPPNEVAVWMPVPPDVVKKAQEIKKELVQKPYGANTDEWGNNQYNLMDKEYVDYPDAFDIDSGNFYPAHREYYQKGYFFPDGSTSKTIKGSNGVNYSVDIDLNTGDIKGYGNPDNIHTWNAESTRATGTWDANGLPKPSIVRSGNESFFGGFAESAGGLFKDLGPIGLIGAAILAPEILPELFASEGAAAGALGAASDLGGAAALGDFGAGIAGLSEGAGALGALSDLGGAAAFPVTSGAVEAAVLPGLEAAGAGGIADLAAFDPSTLATAGQGAGDIAAGQLAGGTAGLGGITDLATFDPSTLATAGQGAGDIAAGQAAAGAAEAVNLGSMNPADYANLGSGAGGNYGITTPGLVNLGSTDPADYANLGSGAGGDYGITTPGLVNLGSTNPADYENLGSGAGGDYGITTPGPVNLGSTNPADYENLGSGAGGNYGIETPAPVNLGSTDPADYENLGSGAGGDYGIGPGGAAASGSLLQKLSDVTGLSPNTLLGLGAGLAGNMLAGGQQQPTGGGGPAQGTVGAGLSPSYQPYRYKPYAQGGIACLPQMAAGGISSLGGYSDGGRLLRGPGDGVSDDIPASIGGKQPARLADGEFVVPARIVSEIGNGSTDAGAKKLYAMMDRVHKARKTAKRGEPSGADKYLPK